MNNNNPRNLKGIKVFTPLIILSFLLGIVGLGFVFFWVFFEEVPINVYGRGIIASASGLYTLDAPVSGNITNLVENIGDAVNEKQKLAEIRINDHIEPIFPISDSRVLAVLFRNHAFVKEGAPLFWMERLKSLNDKDVRIFGYFALVNGKKIEPGMRAKVGIFRLNDNELFTITGTVEKVHKYAISMSNLRKQIPSDEFIEKIFQQSYALISVIIDPDSRFKVYDYVKVFPKQVASIEVEVSKVKPIYYIFPMDESPSSRETE